MTLLIKDGWWAVLRNQRVVGPLRVVPGFGLAGAPGFAQGEWYTELTQLPDRKVGSRGRRETDLDIVFTTETEKEAVLFADAMNRQTDPDRRRAVAEPSPSEVLLTQKIEALKREPENWEANSPQCGEEWGWNTAIDAVLALIKEGGPK